MAFSLSSERPGSTAAIGCVKSKPNISSDRNHKGKNKHINSTDDETIIIMQGNHVKKIVKRHGRKSNLLSRPPLTVPTTADTPIDNGGSRPNLVGSIATQLFRFLKSPTKNA